MFTKIIKWAAALAFTLAAFPAHSLDIERVHTGTAHQVMFDIYATSNRLIAVGSGGEVLHSPDGKAWQAGDFSSEGRALFSVSEKGSNTLAVGQQGKVFRKEGADWRLVESGTTERLFAIAQDGQGRAMAVGGFGAVVKSSDGGRSWQKVSIDWQAVIGQGYEPHVYNVVFDDYGASYIVGEFGMVAKSSDFGESWESLHSGDASVFDLAIGANQRLFAVGQSGLILVGKNGGERWRQLESGTDANLMAVAVRGDGSVLVAGNREAFTLKENGRVVTRVIDPEFLESWFTGIAIYKDDFYAVGEQAKIVKVSF